MVLHTEDNKMSRNSKPHRTRRFEMIWAVDTNSTDEVGLGADQLGHQLACTEVWGGNNIVDELVNLPGLVGLIHSSPRYRQQPVATCTTYLSARTVCSHASCSLMSQVTVRPSPGPL